MRYTVLYSPEDEGGGGEIVAEEADVAPEPEGPLSLADDAQFQWDGLDNPLTGKDLREGFLRQQDYTKKTQELSKQRQDWEKKATEGERAMQYARQLEQQLQQIQQQQQQKPKEDPYAEYFAQMAQQGEIPTSREVKAILNELRTNEIGGLRSELDKMNQQVQYLAQYGMGMTNQIGSLVEDRNSRMKDAAVERALKDAKVTDDEREDAQAIFLNMLAAHEPDEGESMSDFLSAMGEQFSTLWPKLMGYSRARDKAELEQAKRESLPRSGGNASPSGKMKPGDETPNEIVERFMRKK